MIKDNPRRRRLVSAHSVSGHTPSQKSQGRNSRKELKQRSRRSTVYWLVPLSLLSLLSIPRQDHLPRDGTIHSWLVPPTSVIHQEYSPQVYLMEAALPGLPRVVKLANKTSHYTM